MKNAHPTAFTAGMRVFCIFQLTNPGACDKILPHKFGEMSERFKEPVLKTGDPATGRGFESHSLRHLSSVRQIVIRFGVVPKRPKGLPC